MKSILILTTILISCVVMSTGCVGGCITLDGTYKEFGGGITWCPDKTASQSAQRPVLTNDGGESVTIVTEEEAQQISRVLEEKVATANTASISSFSKKEIPILDKFSDLVRKIKNLK